MLRRLIVNADDFGLSSGVNRAVELAWQQGILTQTSLMAGGAAFDEAVAIAGSNPDLQVGLHLTLAQGRPVLPPEKIPDLVGPDGCFPDNPVAVGMKLFFDPTLRLQLRAEIEAQINKIRQAGIQLTHIDGHLNIQMHPTVFALLTELMPLYGITSFRITRERLIRTLRHDRSRIMGKAAERIIFGALSAHAVPSLRWHGIEYAAEVKGILNSGRITEAYLLAVLGELSSGTTEIYLHPGCLPDDEISRRMPGYRHEQELAALLSPAVKQRLKELDIKLCNYRGDEKSYA